MANTRISILIPCLNEKETILKVVNDAKLNGNKFLGKWFEIIIADNGSTDGTLSLLKKVKGIKILNVPVKGYGSALHYGILASKGKYVLFADADLSYPFSNISSFKKVIQENYDLVLGSRLKGSIQKNAMPFLHRYFGTPILTLLLRLIYRIPTSDCNSGMRLVRRDFYKNLNMRNSGMEWASELLCKTAIKNGKYFEVPIRFLKDKRGKAAHLSRWSDGWRHLKTIFLLKPISLVVLSFISLALAGTFYPFNFAVTFLFILIFEILILTYLALRLLETIIENKKNYFSKLLLEFKIVPLLLILTIVQFILLLVIADSHMGTKLILVSLLGVAYMWVFLIETIKTHLVNRLTNEKI